MRSVDDIVAEARRWAAANRRAPSFRIGHEPSNQHYAPVLIEALRNGPLDEDVLLEALDEATASGDGSGSRLIGHLLALDQDDRDAVAEQLQAAT